MLNGSRRTKEILHFFAKKWTEDGIFSETLTEAGKHRTVFNYIKKVKDSFFNFEKEVEFEKGRQLARLDDLYSKNIKIQDFKAAKDIVKEINLMLGLNSPVKSENKNLNYSTEITKEEAKIIRKSLDEKY
jgi:hypothetical protein